MKGFTRFDAEMLIKYDLAASKILDKDYWRVMESFRYYIGKKYSDCYVDVNKGFLTDGASVPFLFKWLVPAQGRYGQAVALHDKLCETYTIIRLVDGIETIEPINRDEIDNILNEAMEVLEVPKWLILVIKTGVDIYRKIANPKKPVVSDKKKALEAMFI